MEIDKIKKINENMDKAQEEIYKFLNSIITEQNEQERRKHAQNIAEIYSIMKIQTNKELVDEIKQTKADDFSASENALPNNMIR